MSSTLIIQGELALAVFDIRIDGPMLTIRRCYRQPDLAPKFCVDVDQQLVDYSDILTPYILSQDSLTTWEYNHPNNAVQYKQDLIACAQTLANLGPFGCIVHDNVVTLTATPEWVAAQASLPHAPQPVKTPDIETADPDGDPNSNIGAAQPLNTDGAIFSPPAEPYPAPSGRVVRENREGAHAGTLSLEKFTCATCNGSFTHRRQIYEANPTLCPTCTDRMNAGGKL